MSKEITTEQLQEKIGELTAAISNIFSDHLGDDKYSCYINVAWEQQVKGLSDPTQRIILVSTPEAEGVPSYENISSLTKSLATDPFLNHVIIYNFTNNLLASYMPSDTTKVKELGKFKHINSNEGVN